MGLFNVVHIQPHHDRTTQGHWDVARLLCFALQSLGHRATLQTNVFDPQAFLPAFFRLNFQSTEIRR